PKIDPANTWPTTDRPNQQVYVDPTFGESFSSTGANLVKDGNFNTSVTPNGADPTGWASVNIGGAGGTVNGGFVLDNGPNIQPELSQEISGLVPGAIYQVSFNYWDPSNLIFYGSSCNDGGNSAATSCQAGDTIYSFLVSVGSGTGNPIFQAVKPSNSNELSATVQFRATDTSEDLIFQSQVGSDVTWAVDNVSVVALNTPAYTVDFDPADHPELLYVDAAGRLTPISATVDPAGYVGTVMPVTCPNGTQCIQYDATTTNGPIVVHSGGAVQSESSGSVYATKNTAAIMPVFESHLEPYYSTVTATKPTTSGADTLTIIDTGSSNGVSANVTSYQIPLNELYTDGSYRDGEPVLNTDHILSNGTASGASAYYFGGEPVVDPISGKNLYFVAGTPVLDPFTCQVVDGPDGQPLTHPADAANDGLSSDLAYHTACDPVVEQRGANVDALGGEQVVDANGNYVYTGSTPFTFQAGQGRIAQPGDPVYDLVGADGNLYAINDPAYTAQAPETVRLKSLASGTSFTLASYIANYTGVGIHSVSVLVYDGSDIYLLTEGADYTVSADGKTVTLARTIPTTCTDGGTVACVQLAFVVETPALTVAGKPVVYSGTEAIEPGDPMLNADSTLQKNAAGSVLLYTSQPMHTVGETYYWNPTANSQTIYLDEAPNSGTLVITIGTIRLKAADFTVSNNTLTLHPTEAALQSVTNTGVLTSLGDTIGVTYTAPVLHSAGEQVYECTTDAAGITSCYGEQYVPQGTSSTETDTTWNPGSATVTLDTAPVRSSLKITIGTTTLGAGDYTLAANVLKLTPTESGLASGAPVK